jgi:parvulin-like peptidyl-prolyl cis-trans isomerase-like protein
VIRCLLREPLLHFFVLGVALFAGYSWLNRGALDSPTEIFVSRNQVSSLQAQFERIWQRAATPDEMQHLVDNWVREEILYREGLAMGLDRDDPVVRRRVGQKIQFIIESVAPAPPTTAELQAWLDAHSAKYATEPVYSLRQVYFDPQRHGTNLAREIASARRVLAGGANHAGDSTLLPPEMRDAPQFEVERAFGKEFASALKDLPAGSWQGPVQSSFGLHLVQISEKSDAHVPPLEQVRAEVERDLVLARTEKANEAMFDKLRANYRVRVESAAVVADPAG